MSKLKERHCVNYRAGTPAISTQQQHELGSEVPLWENDSGVRLKREVQFKTYAASIEWVQQVALIAEREKHHPDIHIYYRRIVLELWTHTVKGLSENDYIMAAKIDALAL